MGTALLTVVLQHYLTNGAQTPAVRRTPSR